jgi:DNA (cytosine-5)-methyltransferase 1
MDFESETFIAHSLRGAGFDASEDGSGRGTPLVFDTTQITSAANFSNPQPGDPCHPLAAGAHPPAIAFNARQTPISGPISGPIDTDPGTNAIAFSCKDHGADAAADFAPTMRATNHAGSHANAGGQLAVQQSSSVRRLTPRECERLQGFPDDYTRIPSWTGWRKMGSDETPEQCIADGMEVKQNKKTGRWRVKDVDGPRYKALGNSWAIPNVRWIGARIDNALRAAA